MRGSVGVTVNLLRRWDYLVFPCEASIVEALEKEDDISNCVVDGQDDLSIN